MDLSASTAGHPALSAIYMAAAVAIPLMLVILIVLRIFSAPARWGGWEPAEVAAWGRRLPYELFVLALPVLAAVGAERLALISLVSGVNRSSEADRLIFATAMLLVGMGISASRFLPRHRSNLSHI